MNEEQLKALGLTDEQIAGVLGAHSDDVKGLKAKIEQVIEKEKQSKLEAKEAQRLANEEAIAKAEAEGNIEALKKAHAKALADATAAHQAELKKSGEAAEALKSQLLGRDRDVFASQIIGKCDKDSKDFVEAMLDKLLDVSYSEDNKAIATFKRADGSVIANDVDSFLEYAKKDTSWQRVLLAENTSGGGATGSSAGTGKSNSDRPMGDAYLARLKASGLV